MSFHKWMLRYMYIPLGGRRYNFLNVWVIFTFVGIWHDVAWRWIVWSLVNCFFLLIETAATTFFNGPKMERLNTSYIYYHWTSIWAPANGILICFAQLTLETAVRSHELVPTYAIAIAYSCCCSISRRAIAVGWHDHRRLRRTVLVLVQCVLAAARWLGDAVDHVRLLVPALAAAPEHSSRREGPAQCLVPMVLSRLVEVTIDTYIQTNKHAICFDVCRYDLYQWQEVLAAGIVSCWIVDRSCLLLGCRAHRQRRRPLRHCCSPAINSNMTAHRSLASLIAATLVVVAAITLSVYVAGH